MKEVKGDFGNLPVLRQNSQPKRSYQRAGVMGRLPQDYRGKSYMVFGRYDHDFLDDYGQTMGWGIKIKAPKIKINVKKFISSIGKAFASVVDIVKETIAAARKVVLAVTPPALHKYIDIVINPIPLITNPTSTIAKLVNPMPLIAMVTNPKATIEYMIDPKPKLAAINYAYKNVLKPMYKSVANVTAELALKPVNNVLDETVYKVLPSSLAAKLEKLTDLPEQAARGKLTADVLREASMAALQTSMTSFAVVGYMWNSAINWARKDGILGPVVGKLDELSGGLIGSAQRLLATPELVYQDKDIEWKRTILDAVMVYLACTGATAFAQMIAANYIGKQTGLSSTPIGRDVLLAGRVYLTASWNAEDAAFEFTKEAAKESGQAVLTETAKREIIIEAAKKGIIDRGTLQDMVTYGTALYGAQNPDGTWNSEQMVEIAKDGVYQEFIRQEVKRITGMDLSLAELTSIYGYAMNPQEILDAVDAAIVKAQEDLSNWDENVQAAYDKAIKDYDNFDLNEFITREMPRFEDNVKNELQRYANGQVDDFIKWAIAQLGPERAKDPKNFTQELLTQYETTVIDLTGQPVPKKKKLNPMVIGAGAAIMAGAAYLALED